MDGVIAFYRGDRYRGLSAKLLAAFSPWQFLRHGCTSGILSRSLHNSAAGGYSVNMVDWKYSSFFSLIWITEKSGQRTPWKSSR